MCLFSSQEHYWSDRRGSEGVQYDVQVSDFSPDLSCSCFVCPVTSSSHIYTRLFIYRHFDKEKSGRLNHQEFKSCLRSLGYDLPMVEEGEPDPEFESILDTVDPNRFVT